MPFNHNFNICQRTAPQVMQARAQAPRAWAKAETLLALDLLMWLDQAQAPLVMQAQAGVRAEADQETWCKGTYIRVKKVEVFLKIMKIIHAKHEVFWAFILAKHKTHTHPNYLHKF